MGRFAIIDTATKAVLNVAIYDGPPGNPPPGYGPNTIAVEHERAGPDWTWDGSQLSAPVIVVPPRVIGPSDIKAEAQRRIIALTGKSNLQDCMIKQFNALMRAGQLTDKRVNGEALTAEETREADTLRAMADRVKAIRSASDVIEAMTPIPADYANDRYWPA